MLNHKASMTCTNTTLMIMVLHVSYVSSYSRSSSFAQARSHGVPRCQLLGVNHAGTSWAPRCRQQIFLTGGRQSPHHWLSCSPHWYMSRLRGVLPPKLAENAACSAHLPTPCPENLKMVYCSHQSAFLHSSSSCGCGVAARAKHLGFWPQTLASIKWIYPQPATNHQPSLPPSFPPFLYRRIR